MATQSKLSVGDVPTRFHTSKRSVALLLVLVVVFFRKEITKRLEQRGLDKALLRQKRPEKAPHERMTLEQGLEQLYIPMHDGQGTVNLLVPTHRAISQVRVRPTDPARLERNYPYFSLPPPVSKDEARKRAKALGPFGTISKDKLRQLRAEEAKITPPAGESITSASATRVSVDREFFRQLRALFRILVPNLRTKEVYIFLLHTFFLVMRTYLSLLVARLDGAIVKSLISADGRGFLRGLGLWFALSVPATYTNAMIRFLQSKLAIGFRTRLTRYVQDLYLNKHANFYKVMNLDNRLEAVSQYITADIAQFCEVIASLYSNVSKPMLDMVIFLYQIGMSLGARGLFAILASYYSAAFALRTVSPAFGKLAAIETKLEGEFRNAHSRLIINAEEIAFYNGAATEESILKKAYRELVRHTDSILKLRIGYSFTEDFVLKYTWSAIGYIVMAAPSLYNTGHRKPARAQTEADRSGIAHKTEDYISNRRLLLSLADAGSRLMYSYKGVAELAGQTSRVYSLISTLHLLDKDEYQSTPRPVDYPADKPFYNLGHLEGRTDDGHEHVQFIHAPIVTPAPGQERGGELLVKDLSLKVCPGDHILITGPNGVGKTAIARVLAGLWPMFDGQLEKPFKEDIMFLPQRAYLTTESLREQVIYPTSYPEHVESGRTDDDLMNILRHVHLAYLPDREGGWTTRKEWKDVLSGGEKQRMGMARLFYHRPKFAVLDECTSAVSTDVEGLMYAHAKDLGITLITISHRPSLIKYHKLLLHLSGDDGTWDVTNLVGDAKEQTVDQEMSDLEQKMSEVGIWHERLAEIQSELNFSKS